MTTDPTRAQADEALMRRCLEALENSVDHVLHEWEQRAEWYASMPTRQAQVAGLKKLADEHAATITAIRQRIAAVAQPLEAKAVPLKKPMHFCRPRGIVYDLPPVTLSGHQLLQALDFVAPDRDADQLESAVCIALRDEGKDIDGEDSPAGHYCWLEEYPEEGSILLGGVDATD